MRVPIPATMPCFWATWAKPEDTSLHSNEHCTSEGRRQVYIPVFRQLGPARSTSSTNLKKAELPRWSPASRPTSDEGRDGSVGLRSTVDRHLAKEGVLGAILCSLVILIFLGESRMTAIAILHHPLSVSVGIIGLYATGYTINVMTLAGLALAIGPLVDAPLSVWKTRTGTCQRETTCSTLPRS